MFRAFVHLRHYMSSLFHDVEILFSVHDVYSYHATLMASYVVSHQLALVRDNL